jgi:hypothetical protein
MTAVETEAGDPFVGLNDAETRLSTRWIAQRERWQDRGVLLLLGAMQLAWIAALCYLGYVFVSA